MTMKHWVAGVPLLFPDSYGATHGNAHKVNYILYNFLRCAGFENIWECDGRILEQDGEVAGETNPNTCPDGDMEDGDVVSWTITDPNGNGSTRAKSSTEVYYGTQALQVNLTSEYNAGAAVKGRFPWESYVNSLNILYPYYITNSLVHRAHRCRFRVFNNSGKTLKARMFGGGVNENRVAYDDGYTDWLDLPSTGDWQEYIIDYSQFCTRDYTEPTPDDMATDVKLEILLPQPVSGTHSATFYLDMVHTYRSLFDDPHENNSSPRVFDGTDGVIANDDELSSSSYTFTAVDVGHYVAIFDPDNAGNSGVYPILSVSAGVATLDLLSSTAKLTAASGRTFRVFPGEGAGNYTELYSARGNSAGWGLKSPHSSGWRLFFRQNLIGGQNYKNTQIWMTPDDAATLHPITGIPDTDGPSTMRNRQERSYDYTSGNNVGNRHCYRGAYYYWASAPPDSYLFVMIDSDRSFVTWVHYDTNDNNHACMLAGKLTSDVYHPNEQAFGLLCRWYNAGLANEIAFDALDYRFGYQATMFDRNGISCRGLIAQLGIGNSTSHPYGQANAGPNPWSGEEWLHPIYIVRDPGGEGHDPSEFETNIGVYEGRSNMAGKTTFGKVHGVGDSFGFASPTVTLTDAAGLFTPQMVGKDITIAGATTGGNNGTFTVTSYISPTQITYDNASGAAEAFTGTWEINMHQYIHFWNGLYWEWRGEVLA